MNLGKCIETKMIKFLKNKHQWYRFKPSTEYHINMKTVKSCNHLILIAVTYIHSVIQFYTFGVYESMYSMKENNP
jgi:hypothetical protein